MFEKILPVIDTEQNRLILVVVGLVMFGGLVYFIFKAWGRRRARARLHQSITSIGIDYLQSVLVPDGMDGSMHVDYLLLTSRGVIVIDLRDLSGNIFGGDQMTEWTVMNGADRKTFQNPQHALYDRVAAVRQLSGDLPVEGRVLFTRRGVFPKGLPRWTLMVDSMRAEFPPPESETFQSWVDRYREAWQGLAATTSPSSLRTPRHFLAEVFSG
jgi:Nuclease-related domain